jgi:DNA-binding transcriptional MocR family regulator
MNITINRKSNQSLSDQIVEGVIHAIESGLYAIGDQLPSIRAMSKTLSVSPMTVVTAYERLEKQARVEKIHGKGVFVSKETFRYNKKLEKSPQSLANYGWQENIRDYVTRTSYTHRMIDFKEDIVNLSTAALHSRFLPTESILDMFSDNRDRFKHLFGKYPPVEGNYEFREELKTYFTNKSLRCTTDQIIVTTGSQLGIFLVASTFIGQGDVVVVGAPTFPGAIDIFKNRGAVVIEVPVDQEGMMMDNLMAICEQYPVKMVYMMGLYQNPTGVCLSLNRCVEIIELAEEYDFIIFEDDSWGEIGFEAPMRPLKVYDTRGRVIYLGGFSKMLGPSFRLSAIVAEGSLYTRLLISKSNMDSGAPLINQLLLSNYINSMAAKQHHLWLCYELKALRDRVAYQLKKYMPSYVKYAIPSGGLVFWFTLPNRFDGNLLYYRCITEAKISFLQGINCYVNIRGENQFRICYTYEEEDVVMAGIKKIAAIIEAIYKVK